MPRRLPCTRLTKMQYDDLKLDLKGKIFVILMNIEALDQKNGDLHNIGIAVLKETRYNLGIVALYLHAIEQLGKLIMVKECESTFNGICYDLESISEDFYKHDEKLDKALSVLPDDCKDIFTGDVRGQLNFDLRLKMLHSDIDAAGNVVLPESVDVDKIKKAIQIFKTEQYSY